MPPQPAFLLQTQNLLGKGQKRCSEPPGCRIFQPKGKEKPAILQKQEELTASLMAKYERPVFYAVNPVLPLSMQREDRSVSTFSISLMKAQ